MYHENHCPTDDSSEICIERTAALPIRGMIAIVVPANIQPKNAVTRMRSRFREDMGLGEFIVLPYGWLADRSICSMSDAVSGPAAHAVTADSTCSEVANPTSAVVAFKFPVT